MLLNIQTITASLGSLLGGELSPPAMSGEPPALNFADMLAAEVVATGETPDTTAAGRLLGLPLLAGDSSGAPLLRFDQLAELLTGLPPAAAKLTLDLPQEASPQADPQALITLTQMMSLLQAPSPLASLGLTVPVEAQPDTAGQNQESDSPWPEEALDLPVSETLLSGELMNLTGLVALAGLQPRPVTPPAENPVSAELNLPVRTATAAKPVVVAATNLAATQLAGENLAAVAPDAEAAAAPAGDFEQALRAKTVPLAFANSSVEPDRAAGPNSKVYATAPSAPQPQVDVTPEAALANLRAVPNAAPASPVPNFVPVEAAVDLPGHPALQQVIDTVEFLSQKGETEVRLHLYPKELGQLHVQLQVIEGQVVVRMVAESSQAQNLIQDHLAQLKAAFSAQGLQVDQMTVNVGGGGADANASGQPSRGNFAQPNWAAPFKLPGEASEQTAPEPRKSRVWGLVNSVDYKI